MKVLRHPIRSIREPFGKAGLIVACVAMVAALTGGAYAAGGGLSGKQKKEVTKIAQTEAKKYAGAPGAPGATGPVGPAGATGPAGTAGAKGEKGEKGEKGDPGTTGAPGAPGKSVEATTIAPNEPTLCNGTGGVELEVEESGVATEICNGQEGEPWNLHGLPKGATETGAWSFNASETSAHGGSVFAPISLSVPLSQKITGAANIHFVETTPDATCPGTVVEPKAPEGMICIYLAEVAGASFSKVRELRGEQANVVDPAGGYLEFLVTENEAFGRGSFAVTGN